jgi:hypothetical protein
MTIRAIGAPLRVQPTHLAIPMGQRRPKRTLLLPLTPANIAGTTDGGRAICARLAGGPSKAGQMRHTVGPGDG